MTKVGFVPLETFADHFPRPVLRSTGTDQIPGCQWRQACQSGQFQDAACAAAQSATGRLRVSNDRRRSDTLTLESYPLASSPGLFAEFLQLFDRRPNSSMQSNPLPAASGPSRRLADARKLERDCADMCGLPTLYAGRVLNTGVRAQFRPVMSPYLSVA